MAVYGESEEQEREQRFYDLSKELFVAWMFGKTGDMDDERIVEFTDKSMRTAALFLKRHEDEGWKAIEYRGTKEAGDA